MPTNPENNDQFEKNLDDKYGDSAAFGTDKTSKEISDPEKAAMQDKDGPPYNPDSGERGGVTKRRFRAKYSKPLIAATAVGGAGVIAWSSFIAGPAQFIQAAQLLQEFHFTSNEDAANSRMTRLWRYARNPNDPGKRRLSTLGNKLADAMDAKALANGFEFTDKTTSGRARRLTVDTNKYGKSVPEAIAEFEKAGYTAVDMGNGVVDVDIDRASLTSDRKLMKLVSRGSGVNRVVGSVGFRKVKIRNLVGLGPVRYLERKAADDIGKRYGEWRENRKSNLTTADAGALPTGRTAEVDADGDGATDAPTAGTPEAAGTNFNKADIQTRAARGIGIVGLVTGVGCAAVAVSDQVDSFNYALVQVPLMKSAMEMMSFAGMIMSGTATEDTWEEFGYASEAFTQEAVEADTAGTGAIKASSWIDAEDIKTELGESTEGSTPPPKEVYIDPDGNVVSEVVNSIPGINGVCTAVASIPGQIIFGVADVISSASLVGPLAGQAASTLFADDILDALLGWFRGDPLDLGGVAGANYGSYLNFGTFYTANESAIAQAGRALSKPEVAELKLKERQDLIDVANEKGLFYRTLDKSNPRSVVSSFARQAPDSVSQFATALFTSPFKILSSLKTFIPGMATYAVGSGFDYGIPKYGFSLAELENDNYDNPYDNANNYFSDDERLNFLRDEWGEKCFGVKIFEDTGRLEFSDGRPYKDILDDCPQLEEGAPQTEEFTRYRMYILDTVTAYSGACYAGDEEACGSLGFGGVNGNTTTTGLDGVECPANLEAHPTAAGYFRMPDAPGGEYDVLSPDRYGSEQLVCVLHSVGVAYNDLYAGTSKLRISDLTAASGHQTHKTGINVDIDAGGDIAAADYTAAAVGDYSPQHTIALGKLFIDTRVVKTILWCESPGDGTTRAMQDYATQLGVTVDIRCYPGHQNHFHVTILDSYALPELY